MPDISLNAIANLGYADLRFLRPVYSGDTLRVESEILGLRETSNRKSGVVYTRSNAFNQEGDAVLTWVRFLVWLDIGMVIYWFYGRTHSPLVNKQEAAGRTPMQSPSSVTRRST